MTTTGAPPAPTQEPSSGEPLPPPDRSIIRLDDVGKKFDDTWVLRGIDLEIPRGVVFGMIGPSGCGKTTTVRMILGDHRPDEGTIELLGDDPIERSKSARKSVGYLPQHPALFEDLSLWQNLNYHASLNGVRFRRRDRLEELLELVDLESDRSKKVSEASGGMKRRLALAATLVHDPPVLMLDEPTAGIDPILRGQLWEEFRRMRDDGTTLLVTTQFVEEAAYCDIVAILAHGNVAGVGSPRELVIDAYGGRRFDVQFDQHIPGQALDALAASESLVRVQRTDPDLARVIVAPSDALRSASDETRAVREVVDEALASAGGELSVVGVSEVAVDWNDVFSRLVEQDGDQDDEASDVEPAIAASDEPAPEQPDV